MRTLREMRWVLPIVLFGGACSSIIGIEDIYEEPKADDGGGGDGSGGSSSGQGGSTSGQGGSGQGGSGGASGGANGGTGGEAGGGDMGGAGGTGGTPSGAVDGKIIDFWGRELSNVPVELSADGVAIATVVSDSDGNFTVEDVPESYDVQFVVQWTENRTEIYGWRFEGLSRRDPTLQVFSGLPPRSARTIFTPQNATIPSTRRLDVVFGGPDGAPSMTGVGANGRETYLDWRGPATTQVTMRALLWEFAGANDLPTAYVAYNTTPGVLAEGQTNMFMPDMSDMSDIQSGNITGTVTSALSSGERVNSAFVRFANGDGSTGAIQVVNDDSGPNSFTYLVPNLPQGSIVVAASQGNAYDGPYAIAFKDGLAPGATTTLEIPAAPQLLSPSPGATGATTDTVFRWVGGSGPYVLSYIDQDFYQGAFVVTANTETTLPTFPGFSLRAGGEHRWTVETHGSFASMDALAGPQGYIQAITDGGAPRGPRRGDGTFATSTWFQVFVAP